MLKQRCSSGLKHGISTLTLDVAKETTTIAAHLAETAHQRIYMLVKLRLKLMFCEVWSCFMSNVTRWNRKPPQMLNEKSIIKLCHRVHFHFRPHHLTTYVHVSCRQSNVVCRSICHSHEPYKNDWTNRDSVWVVDPGGPKKPCSRLGSRSPYGKCHFWVQCRPFVKYRDALP